MRRAGLLFGAVLLAAVLVWLPCFSFGAVLFSEAAAEEWEEEETLKVPYRGEEGPGMEEEPGIEEELSDSGIWEEGEDLLEEDPFVETESLEEEWILLEEVAWDESAALTEEDELPAETALVESAWEEIPASEAAGEDDLGEEAEEEAEDGEEEHGLGYVGYLLFGSKEEFQPTGYLAGKTVHVGPNDDICNPFGSKEDFFYSYYYNEDLNTFGVNIGMKYEDIDNKRQLQHAFVIPEEDILYWAKKMGVDLEGKLTYLIYPEGEDECTAYSLYKNEGCYSFFTDHPGTYVFGWCDAGGTERERQIEKFAEDLQNAFQAVPEDLEKLAEEKRLMYRYGNSYILEEQEYSDSSGTKIWNGDRIVRERNPAGILYMNFLYHLWKNYIQIEPFNLLGSSRGGDV